MQTVRRPRFIKRNIETNRRGCAYIGAHTHVIQAVEYDIRFFLNPGTAIGAWIGGFTDDSIPSFALMDTQGTVVVTYLYQLVKGEVRVEKIEWRKDVEASQPTAAAAVGAGAGATASGGAMTSSGPKSTALPQAIPTSPPPAGAPSVVVRRWWLI